MLSRALAIVLAAGLVRESVVDEERPPAGQVAVFIDFENLVLGAGKGLPGQANPVPYAGPAVP